MRFLVGLLLACAACGEAPAPAPTTAGPVHVRLWRFLESYRTRSDMPTTQEIVAQFGEPADRAGVSWEERPEEASEAGRFRRYTDADRQSDWLTVAAWRYDVEGDNDRWTYVVVRGDGTVAGWEWFENVPAGQETGPPR